jgi:hypothetical protein
MSDLTLLTTAEVLARVDRAWGDLEDVVRGLTPRELGEVRDPAGWAVKDHLVHLVAWERALVARLDGRPEHEALDLDEATAAQEDGDAVNAAIFARHRDRPLAEVLDTVRAEHARTRARLAALADAELPRPLPDGRPAAVVIEGNTWAHYGEHLGWIRELVGRA